MFHAQISMFGEVVNMATSFFSKIKSRPSRSVGYYHKNIKVVKLKND